MRDIKQSDRAEAVADLRQRAKRARRLSQGLSPADQERFLQYAEELEATAIELEQGAHMSDKRAAD